MKFPISIRTAFCLPEPDVNALVQGQTIVALSRSFLQAEQQFALCPIKDLEEDCDTTVQAWAGFLPALMSFTAYLVLHLGNLMI